MVNERKTEIITRKHFSKFLDQIYIEEQSSDDPKINKGNYPFSTSKKIYLVKGLDRCYFKIKRAIGVDK